jgi:hypothetical protein
MVVCPVLTRFAVPARDPRDVALAGAALRGLPRTRQRAQATRAAILPGQVAHRVIAARRAPAAGRSLLRRIASRFACTWVQVAPVRIGAVSWLFLYSTFTLFS